MFFTCGTVDCTLCEKISVGSAASKPEGQGFKLADVCIFAQTPCDRRYELFSCSLSIRLFQRGNLASFQYAFNQWPCRLFASQLTKWCRFCHWKASATNPRGWNIIILFPVQPYRIYRNVPKLLTLFWGWLGNSGSWWAKVIHQHMNRTVHRAKANRWTNQLV